MSNTIFLHLMYEDGGTFSCDIKPSEGMPAALYVRVIDGKLYVTPQWMDCENGKGGAGFRPEQDEPRMKGVTATGEHP